MIGYQQPASQPNQMGSLAGAPSAPAGPRPSSPAEAPAGLEAHQQHLPQLSQHCQEQRLSLLAAKTNHPGQQPESTEPTQARAIASSSSPSPTSGHQSHQLRHKSSPAGRRVSSPGYHSAASSPGSSVSSLVSSSASSSASSSGVSSASSEHHHLQRPIPSPTCSMSSSTSTLSSSAGAAGLAPITTMAQLAGGGGVESDRQLAAAAAAVQAISCANAKLTSGAPQISIASIGFPAGHLSLHAQDQPQQRPASHHLSHHRPAQQHPHQQLHGASQPNLLDYYPEAQQDGLNLSWFHAANSRQALGRALASDRAIVAGDISLAELSRYPVPIMARPPLGVSDLTLENWLSDVIQARKGIKLTFTSTRTVEPAFRVLARHAEHLKGPIILSADILTRPAPGACGPAGKPSEHSKQQQQQQPVDAWTFLMLCRTRFPKSIISIGWCPAGPGQDGGPLGLESAAVQQAPDSSTSAESMFELDMLMDSQQAGASFGQPLLHLAPAFGQRSSLGSLSVVQQLAAVAAAAAANNHHDAHRLGAGAANQPGRPQHAGYNLSSTGSMNSSSGNSSGSPSPTSPVGHLLLNPGPHQQQQQQQQAQLLSQRHHHQLQRHLQARQGHHHLQHPSSAEQLMFAAAAAAAAAASADGAKPNSSLAPAKHHAGHPQAVGWPSVAAMMAASVSLGDEAEARAHALKDHDDEDEDEGQLPLNLNINEADPQHASQTLSELAAKIKSLQQESNSLSRALGGAHESAALSLAGKLFAAPDGHISKKAALAHRLNSNSPSPVSTSPKHQHQQQQYHQHHLQHHHQDQNNLLCVKPTGMSLAGLAAAQQKQKQQLAAKQEARQQAAAHRPGYTREMIDKMASLVKEYNLTQPITFPVEARLLGRNSNSLAELQRLLYQVGSNSTLTVVAQPEDLISVDDLLTIRKHFATNQILFDLPDELTASLRHELELL